MAKHTGTEIIKSKCNNTYYYCETKNKKQGLAYVA